MLLGGRLGHYRWRCVGFKGRIQQLRFNSQRLGHWKSGCILHCTEAGGKTEVTFQRTYNYSQRKLQKRRLSHLQQQHHFRRSFEACWFSKIKTGSTYQRCCLHFESYHQKCNPFKPPFKWNHFNDIIDGEVQIPEQLTQLFTHLVVGPDHRSHEFTSKIRRIESLAADTVFPRTNGKKKTSNHLKLGLAVKSMAGSKKLIGMLNRYGHYVSYSTKKELETELTITVTLASKTSSPDLVPDSSLTVGIAYDNFAWFVETLSGKDTYHTRELSFCKWWFNERKKEKKKNLGKFWCGCWALS